MWKKVKEKREIRVQIDSREKPTAISCN